MLLFVAVTARPLRINLKELVDFLALDLRAGPIPKFHEAARSLRRTAVYATPFARHCRQSIALWKHHTILSPFGRGILDIGSPL